MIKINQQTILEPLNIEDAPDIFSCIEQNRQMLSTYLYWVEDVVDLQSTIKYIDERVNSTLPNKQWFKIKFNGEICGIFAIKSIDENAVAEIGYWLSEQVHGNNIITCIVTMLLRNNQRWAFKCIEFRCLCKNLASIGVAKKIGAVKEDTLFDFLTIDDCEQDLEIYRIRC